MTINLVEPRASFTHILATSQLSIVPREAVRALGADFGVHPVGTGPFTLGLTEPRATLRYLKNPHYHRHYPKEGMAEDSALGLLKDAGKPLPLVDVIEVPLIEENQPQMLKLLNAEIDMASIVDRATYTRTAARDANGRLVAKEPFTGRLAVHEAPTLRVSYLVVNTRDPALGDRRVRQALAHLVDADAIIQLVDGGRGWRAHGLVPDGLAGNSRDTASVARAYDPKAARKLLAEAGYSEARPLPPLVVSFAYGHERQRTLFDVLKLKAAAGGVTLKPSFLDLPTYIKETDSGKFQLGWESWEADYPDAESMVSFLHSRNIGGGWNHAQWVNAEFDRLYDELRTEISPTQRLALLKRMQAIVHDEVPLVPAQQSVVVTLVHPWVRNFKAPAVSQHIYEYLDVDMAAKQARR